MSSTISQYQGSRAITASSSLVTRCTWTLHTQPLPLKGTLIPQDIIKVWKHDSEHLKYSNEHDELRIPIYTIPPNRPS